MLPDACILTDFSLARLTGMMDRLTVMQEGMAANLEATLGLHNSQRVLLALTSAGLPRQEAYEIVQSSVGPQAKSTREIAQALVELYEQIAGQASESRDDAQIETWRKAAEGEAPESLVTK